MNLHINDANILIDVVQLDIVEAFMALNFDLYTTTFVFAELNAQQQQLLTGTALNLLTPSAEALEFIYEFSLKYNGLSIEDCSVLYFAEKLKGYLISGDGKLRKVAKARQIEVKGIIYILEQIKQQELLDAQTCIAKLQELKTHNERLPLHEIDARLEAWRSELNNLP